MAQPYVWSPTANSTLASPADFDLNIPVWMGEVQAARTSPLFVARSLANKTPDFASGNRTAKFTVTGSVGVERHEKGDQHYGMDYSIIEREIGVNDRPYRTSLEHEDLLTRFEQVDTRSHSLKAMGYALAAHQEVEAIRRIIAAAQYTNTASTPSEFRTGGNAEIDAFSSGTRSATFTNTQTGAQNLQKLIKTNQIMQSKMGNPQSNWYCVVKPELFYEFRALTLMDPSHSGVTGAVVSGGIFGNLDMATMKTPLEVFGIETPLRYMNTWVLPHNLFDATYDAKVRKVCRDWTGDPDVDIGDASATVGVLYQQDCAGIVDVMNTEFDIRPKVERTDNDLIIAKVWGGGGTLNPERAIQIVNS